MRRKKRSHAREEEESTPRERAGCRKDLLCSFCFLVPLLLLSTTTTAVCSPFPHSNGSLVLPSPIHLVACLSFSCRALPFPVNALCLLFSAVCCIFISYLQKHFFVTAAAVGRGPLSALLVLSHISSIASGGSRAITAVNFDSFDQSCTLPSCLVQRKENLHLLRDNLCVSEDITTHPVSGIHLTARREMI